MKRCLFIIFVMVSAINACSLGRYVDIRSTEYLASKILNKCYNNNKNAFCLSSTYANFSVVWSYGVGKIEVYHILKGNVKKKEEYDDNDIQCITSQVFDNVEQIVYNECELVLDGDMITVMFEKDGKKHEIAFPIDVNCFKNADHKSFFLNELAKDIIVYKMWDI